MSISPTETAKPTSTSTTKSEPTSTEKPGGALPSAAKPDEFVKSDSKPGAALPGDGKPTKGDEKKKGDSSRLNPVKAILKQVAALFMSTATRANPIFRIAINRIGNNLLLSAASLLQSILVDAGVKGTDLEGEATSLNSSVQALVGMTNQNVQEHEGTIKSENGIKKGLDDLAKLA